MLPWFRWVGELVFWLGSVSGICRAAGAPGEYMLVFVNELNHGIGEIHRLFLVKLERALYGKRACARLVNRRRTPVRGDGPRE
ncbi:MAG: hypothetical protein M1608_01690 [Candidatus Omnitrophica bacterium]|nr:hypothetical protein [Candidatus Omnitrophota bacterium]